MDPNQSNDGSQGGFPGGNMFPFQGGWNPYMYGYQAPPPWALQPPATNVPMMHPVVQVPESADTSVEVEEVSASAMVSGKVKKVGRSKLSNFNPDEDKYLVQSWLEICCDPITNTGQKKEHMWERILQRYNMRRGSYPERSVRSLQSRWDYIKAEVGKFSSFYADVLRENSSGMSDADKTTHAAANFAGVTKHNFAFMHCWDLMKDEPKWQDAKVGASAKSGTGEGFGEDACNLGDDNSGPTPPSSERPMGRDAAKLAKKKANSSPGSTSSSEYASSMKELSLQRVTIMQEEVARKNDRFQQLQCIDEKRFQEMRSHNDALLSLEQEKIRMKREKHDMERQKHDIERQEKEKQEDERILAIDLDSCTPALRVYYTALQEEILEKIAARRGKRQGM